MGQKNEKICDLISKPTSVCDIYTSTHKIYVQSAGRRGKIAAIKCFLVNCHIEHQARGRVWSDDGLILCINFYYNFPFISSTEGF